jgi:hypothetical protein
MSHLWPDHVLADCTYASHCLRCHREGHQARACMYPCSPDSVGPPSRQPTPMVVLNPVGGGGVGIALAGPAPKRAATMTGGSQRPWLHSPVGSSTPPRDDVVSMPDGSPSRHTLPSPFHPRLTDHPWVTLNATNASRCESFCVRWSSMQ